MGEPRPGLSSAVAVAVPSSQHAHISEKQEISFPISLLELMRCEMSFPREKVLLR